MGGKGSGRKAKIHDQLHRVIREKQLTYDREITKIRKEHNCAFFEAQEMRRQQRMREGKPTRRLRRLEKKRKK